VLSTTGSAGLPAAALCAELLVKNSNGSSASAFGL